MQENEDFEADMAEHETSVTEAAGTKPSVRKKGAAAKGARGKGGRSGKEPCLVENCADPRASQCRFCTMHKRSEDAMKYQASKQGGNGEALKLLTKVLMDDVSAAFEVSEFSKLNPPDKKYSRKSLTQWAST